MLPYDIKRSEPCWITPARLGGLTMNFAYDKILYK